MTEIASIAEYELLFPADKRSEALKIAHDVRKFEIELYWKRATYFWTIIGVAFAGYFALGEKGTPEARSVVASLGFVFSFGWYMVNRSSTAWQRNWEIHVDLLENGLTGPLYKTYLQHERYSVLNLVSPYSFSPNKVNAILSLLVFITWGGLLFGPVIPAPWRILSAAQTNVGFALVGLASLLIWGRSGINKPSQTFLGNIRGY